MTDDREVLEQIRSEGLPTDLDRPHQARGYSARPLFVMLGLAFLLAAFWPAFFRYLDDTFGVLRLVVAGLGMVFLQLAIVSKDIGRVRERLLDLVEQILKLFYGPNFRRERQAVDILVRSMGSADAGVRATSRTHLTRLTGEDKGDDPEAWTAWWDSHRATFRAVSTERPSDDRT